MDEDHVLVTHLEICQTFLSYPTSVSLFTEQVFTSQLPATILMNHAVNRQRNIIRWSSHEPLHAPAVDSLVVTGINMIMKDAGFKLALQEQVGIRRIEINRKYIPGKSALCKQG